MPHDTFPDGLGLDAGPAPSIESLFACTTGPRDARIILVGEAFELDERAARRPFTGSAGKELDRILSDAGLSRASILCTNLINAVAPRGDFNAFLNPSAKGGKKGQVDANLYRGISIKPEFRVGIDNCFKLISWVDPDLVIVAGNWPLWALRGDDVDDVSTTAGFKTPKGITKWRGSQLYTRCIERRVGETRSNEPGVFRGNKESELRDVTGTCYPLLPIIHPAAILREWGYRTITVHDLRARAGRFVGAGHRKVENGGEVCRDGTGRGEVTISRGDPCSAKLEAGVSWNAPPHHYIPKPSFEEVRAFLSSCLSRLRLEPLWLSVDLETYRRRWISVIGLADAELAIAIPLFYVNGEQTINYFTLDQEVEIWQQLKLILEHKNVKIIGQNFIYDTQWFHRYYNIRALVTLDTMVAHHLLFPGTPKSLDRLASLYCEHYSYWKDESGDWDQFPADALRYWTYNCKDTRATYDIAMTLRDALAASPGMEALYAFQLEQWTLSREMMLRGTLFDTNLQGQMRLQLLQEANNLSQWLLSVVPTSWQYTSTGKPWYDSPKGSMELLYGALGLPPQIQKKTKQPTVDAEALAALRASAQAAWLEPLLERLEALRSVGVFISHFLDARISPDSKIRCTFNIAHPETFRWSSSANGFGEGTNLQNVPKGDQ